MSPTSTSSSSGLWRRWKGEPIQDSITDHHTKDTQEYPWDEIKKNIHLDDNTGKDNDQADDGTLARASQGPPLPTRIDDAGWTTPATAALPQSQRTSSIQGVDRLARSPQVTSGTSFYIRRFESRSNRDGGTPVARKTRSATTSGRGARCTKPSGSHQPIAHML